MRLMGAKLIHADGQSDGQIDTTKLIVAFRNFAILQFCNFANVTEIVSMHRPAGCWYLVIWWHWNVRIHFSCKSNILWCGCTVVNSEDYNISWEADSFSGSARNPSRVKGTRNFTAVFKRAPHCFLFSATWMQSHIPDLFLYGRRYATMPCVCSVKAIYGTLDIPPDPACSVWLCLS